MYGCATRWMRHCKAREDAASVYGWVYCETEEVEDDAASAYMNRYTR